MSEIASQEDLDAKPEMSLDDARRKAMRRVAWYVAAGAVAGLLLILLAGVVHGFWSRLADGVGAGFLVAAFVAAITPRVAAYYNYAFPSRTEIVLNRLDSLLGLEEEFLIEWKARQLAAEDERREQDERWEADLRRRIERPARPGESDKRRQADERLKATLGRILEASQRHREADQRRREAGGDRPAV